MLTVGASRGCTSGSGRLRSWRGCLVGWMRRRQTASLSKLGKQGFLYLAGAGGGIFHSERYKCYGKFYLSPDGGQGAGEAARRGASLGSLRVFSGLC